MNQQNLPFIYTSQEGRSYVCEEKIGQGAQGMIYKGYKQDQPNLKVAIKFSDDTRDDELQFLYRLKKTSNQFHHIIQYYDVDYDKNSSFKKYCFVMELGSKNLLEEIQFTNNKDESQKIQIIQQIAFGINEIHQFKHIHRDIKPENIIQVGDKWKLCDFGFLKHQISKNVTQKVGTPYYIAPEIAFQDPTKNVQYNTKVDIWSFGCIIYEFLTGDLFFQGDSQEEVVQQIYSYCQSQISNAREKNKDNRFNRIKNPKLQKLCKCTMTVDPEQRYDTNQVIEELNNLIQDKPIIPKDDANERKTINNNTPNTKFVLQNQANMNTQPQIQAPTFLQSNLGQNSTFISTLQKPQSFQQHNTFPSIQSFPTKDQKAQPQNLPQFQLSNNQQAQQSISQSNSKIQLNTLQPQQFQFTQTFPKPPFQPQFLTNTQPQITSIINQPNIESTQNFQGNNNQNQNQVQVQALMTQHLKKIVQPNYVDCILNYYQNQKIDNNCNDAIDYLQIIVNYVNNEVSSKVQNITPLDNK
ncbi:unnamed protein product (macronuclear) [Paramecium tetraurelia]|uniref:Protein kinase domain-containing protein n=1 Tax=Paramecium tetraurelia TaxID=5888 RepID=A0EFE6_PARTE|nr:uncharacterized protein GSPATT00026360001 [Paramecium tetraurelia]CAK94037.1 unnamed protein product [Paramecium tetraurelia]|eukprot:XP_001461410.1 hypothetical protein (macronuclear) [Paramecium tetraurelia strain d4-2]